MLHTSIRRVAPVALLAAGALTLAACGSSSSTSSSTPSASAGGDQVTAIPSVTSASGQTTGVTLNTSTVAALTSLGVKLAPLGTATVSDGEILFPITSGYAEIHSDLTATPGYVQGSLNHDTSGFSLTAGKTVVDLSNFVVDPGGSMLYGTVNGKTAGVPLLTLDGSALKITKDGTTLHLDGTVAKLTQTAASALDTAFGTTAVKAGLPLGVAHITLDASQAVTFAKTSATTVPLLKGTSTSVKLDTDTVKALTSLGVSVAPYGTASVADGSATFPITGGFAAIHSDKAFKPGYILGNINHEGSGLTFSAGSKSLTVEDFAVDPGGSMLYAYVPALKADVALLFLDGTNVKVSMDGSNIVLDGTVAKLTAGAAQALDSFFGTTAIKGGTPLGTVHLVATPAS